MKCKKKKKIPCRLINKHDSGALFNCLNIKNTTLLFIGFKHSVSQFVCQFLLLPYVH